MYRAEYKYEVLDLIDKIHNLKDAEIDMFINDRLSIFKNNEQKVVGYNSNNYIYNGFFDDNVRVNTLSEICDEKKNVIFKYAGFKVDDNNIYRCLIHNINRIYDPILAVAYAVDDYFDLRNNSTRNPEVLYESNKVRNKLYRTFAGREYTLSVGFIRTENLALCSEISAVAHNMFKFIGIDVDYMVGLKNDEDHSFNMIYPWGREKSAILFDASRNPKSDPIFYYIDSEEKEKLFTGEEIEVDEKNVDAAVDRLFHTNLINNPKKTDKYSISNVIYSENNEYDYIPDTDKYKLVLKKQI